MEFVRVAELHKAAKLRMSGQCYLSSSASQQQKVEGLEGAADERCRVVRMDCSQGSRTSMLMLNVKVTARPHGQTWGMLDAGVVQDGDSSGSHASGSVHEGADCGSMGPHSLSPKRPSCGLQGQTRVHGTIEGASSTRLRLYYEGLA